MENRKQEWRGIFGREEKQTGAVLVAGRDWLGRIKTEKHRFYNPLWKPVPHPCPGNADLPDVPLWSVVVFPGRCHPADLEWDSEDPGLPAGTAARPAPDRAGPSAGVWCGACTSSCSPTPGPAGGRKRPTSGRCAGSKRPAQDGGPGAAPWSAGRSWNGPLGRSRRSAVLRLLHYPLHLAQFLLYLLELTSASRDKRERCAESVVLCGE